MKKLHLLNRESRFWAKVKKTLDGCWLWQASIIAGGYGQFDDGYAHRFSWELHFGPIPDGLFVLHDCDIRNCVRPDHLWLGTQLDNMRDMRKKGRGVDNSGSNCGKAILTEADVKEVRILAKTQTIRALAKKYKIGKTAMGYAVNGTTWKHVS